jgi:hypothetical protein
VAVIDLATEQGWLTLAEAAKSLGLSTDAVRRRLKRGELAGRQVVTRHGPAWQVNLDIAPTPAPTLAPTVAPMVPGTPTLAQTVAPTVAPGSAEPEPGLVEMVRLVDKLSQQVLELSGRVGYLQSELRQRDEQLKALQAPQPDPPAEEPPATTAPAEAPPRPSWWRRVLLGE